MSMIIYCWERCNFPVSWEDVTWPGCQCQHKVTGQLSSLLPVHGLQQNTTYGMAGEQTKSWCVKLSPDFTSRLANIKDFESFVSVSSLLNGKDYLKNMPRLIQIILFLKQDGTPYSLPKQYIKMLDSDVFVKKFLRMKDEIWASLKSVEKPAECDADLSHKN